MKEKSRPQLTQKVVDLAGVEPASFALRPSRCTCLCPFLSSFNFCL